MNKPPILLGEKMIGSDRLGYALEVRGLRCVVWFEGKYWLGSISFANRTIVTATAEPEDCVSKQAAANAIEQWLLGFANEILIKCANKVLKKYRVRKAKP